MYLHEDDDLGLGKQETAWLWHEDQVLYATAVQVRGDHIFDETDLGSGEYQLLDPATVAAAAGDLIAPRVYIEHEWNDVHPQDVNSPCELSIHVGGWRPQTDDEKAQVALSRSGEFTRRRRAAAAQDRVERLERETAQARAHARRFR